MFNKELTINDEKSSSNSNKNIFDKNTNLNNNQMIISPNRRQIPQSLDRTRNPSSLLSKITQNICSKNKNRQRGSYKRSENSYSSKDPWFSANSKNKPKKFWPHFPYKRKYAEISDIDSILLKLQNQETNIHRNAPSNKRYRLNKCIIYDKEKHSSYSLQACTDSMSFSRLAKRDLQNAFYRSEITEITCFNNVIISLQKSGLATAYSRSLDICLFFYANNHKIFEKCTKIFEIFSKIICIIF